VPVNEVPGKAAAESAVLVSIYLGCLPGATMRCQVGRTAHALAVTRLEDTVCVLSTHHGAHGRRRRRHRESLRLPQAPPSSGTST